MSLYSAVRHLTVLGINVVEAVVYSVFDFDEPSDRLWSEACDRLVEREAEEEVAEPQQSSSVADPSPEATDERRGGCIPNHDVEPPRYPNLSVATLFVAEAAVREMAATPGSMGYGRDFLYEVAAELHGAYETCK